MIELGKENFEKIKMNECFHFGLSRYLADLWLKMVRCFLAFTKLPSQSLSFCNRNDNLYYTAALFSMCGKFNERIRDLLLLLTLAVNLS